MQGNVQFYRHDGKNIQKMKKSDINLIESFVNHMGKVFDYMPNLPYSAGNRTYNAYRVARRNEYRRLKRKIEQWKMELEEQGYEQDM